MAFESSPLDPRLARLVERIASAMMKELWDRVQRGDPPVAVEYLTAAQVSAMTGISAKSLERWRSTRKGPRFFKLGRRGRVRYRIQDVRDWIEAGGPVE